MFEVGLTVGDELLTGTMPVVVIVFTETNVGYPLKSLPPRDLETVWAACHPFHVNLYPHNTGLPEEFLLLMPQFLIARANLIATDEFLSAVYLGFDPVLGLTPRETSASYVPLVASILAASGHFQITPI